MLRDPFSDFFQGDRPFAGLFRRPAGGGPRRSSKAPPPDEGEDGEPLEPEAGPEEAEAPADKAVLMHPKWEIEEVGFNEETEISVEAEVPEAHAHKTRVEFELFAKVPAGDDPQGGMERISKAEGNIEGGRAKARIPVYIPQYRDEEGRLLSRVEYFFTARHSLSDLLKDETVVKVVDHMAERLLKAHVLEDVNFATGRSFPQTGQAEDFKALAGAVKAWRDEFPEGKVAVFGHADAVGRETDNKALSERRARAVHAFLAGEPKAWEALHGEERWGLASTQELLKHLGHDPGPIDGEDGPKTQAAVKDFQGSRDLAVDGVAGPKTREALYLAYMEACGTPGLKEKSFDVIDGRPFTGCSEFNLAEKVEGACEKNRRVTVCLLKSNRNFPIQYPCRQGDIAPCKSQVERKGGRRTAGFGCRFYDELVREAGGGSGDAKILNLSLGLPYSEDRLAVRKFIFECAGQTISGEVPEDGKLAIRVPAGATGATLRLDPEAEGGGLVWKLALSDLPPVEDVKGTQIRLNNLGFNCGPEDGVLGKRTRVGLRTFQQRHGLPVNGEADGATLAKIKEAYGG